MAIRTVALICLLVSAVSADLVLQGAKTTPTTVTVTVTPMPKTPVATPVVKAPVVTQPVAKTPVVTQPVATKTPVAKPVVAPVVTPVVAPTAKAPAAKAVACPAPLSACDLSFGGATTLRAVIRASTMNQVITARPVVTKAGLAVTSLSTYGCTIVGQPLTPCSGFGFFGATNDAQAQTTLGMFPVPADVAQTLTGKCIKLAVNNFEVNGTWVNVGDGNPTYPAARRCILIQT